MEYFVSTYIKKIKILQKYIPLQKLYIMSKASLQLNIHLKLQK